MAASFDGLLLVSPHEPLWVYAELALEPKGLPVRYFASAKEALFWLRDHTPKAILLDTDLDVDPFAVASRIRHVRRRRRQSSNVDPCGQPFHQHSGGP